jgi:hypothetical protein
MADDAPHGTSGDLGGGRAFVPGPHGRYYAIAAAAVLAIAVVVFLLVHSSTSKGGEIDVAGHHEQASTRYGHPPKWEKIPEPPKTQTVTASPAHPQLKAMEGYPVHTTLPGGATTWYSVVGPSIPNWVANEADSGKWRIGETAPSTFELTFSHVSGTVHLSSSDFTVITYTGQLLHPKITTTSGAPMPSTVRTGQSLDLMMKTSLPEGDGELRWAPSGQKILVSFFWTLEFD